MKRLILGIISVVLVVLFITGCGNNSVGNVVTNLEPNSAIVTDNQGPVKDINIEAYDWGFNQDKVVINKGDHVVLHITSKEGTHGVMIPGLGLSTGEFSPGEERVIEFDAEETGSLDYFCNVPCGSGHREMRGQLVIEE